MKPVEALTLIAGHVSDEILLRNEYLATENENRTAWASFTPPVAPSRALGSAAPRGLRWSLGPDTAERRRPGRGSSLQASGRKGRKELVRRPAAYRRRAASQASLLPYRARSPARTRTSLAGSSDSEALQRSESVQD